VIGSAADAVDRDPIDRALRAELARVRDDIVRVRRHLHAHPELAFQEVQTATLIAIACEELGMRVRGGVGGTGVLADVDGARPGPTVLVRADMDALPIEEGDDGRPYRSTVPGVMHACGHDGHVAIALAVGTVLVRLRSWWGGRLRLCFQPAEEVDEGARRMIADGALDSVDHVVGLHLQADLPSGSIGIGAGVQWASSDELRMTISGAGGHAGDPRSTIDPIAAAARVVLEVRRVAEEERRRWPAVVTIAQIHGGTAPNVLPDAVTLAGTLRATGQDGRSKLLAEVRRAAGHVVTAEGASLELSTGAHCPAVVCDPVVTERLRRALQGAFGAERVLATHPSTTADDIGEFLRAVPGCYFRVGAGDPASEAVPHHHRLFDLDERAMPVAAEALARAALALLPRA